MPLRRGEVGACRARRGNPQTGAGRRADERSSKTGGDFRCARSRSGHGLDGLRALTLGGDHRMVCDSQAHTNNIAFA
jgi:hypothetical protein